MGNIRQTYIKRVAIELVRLHPGAFNADYRHNREKVLELTDLKPTEGGGHGVRYKKLTNRIAGYVTRYHKRQARIVA